MRKGFLAICLSLVVAVVLLAAFVPSCAPTTGTIQVKATLDGSPWQGAVSYTLTPASGSLITGTTVEKTLQWIAVAGPVPTSPAVPVGHTWIISHPQQLRVCLVAAQSPLL